MAGVRLVAHELLTSTNAEALTLARAGERGPLWIVAERQSAGRGRHGRAWVSERGNLFATLLLTDPGPPEHWPELSLVAAQEERVAQAELRALRAQISPHFIYNALAAVAGEIHGQPEDAPRSASQAGAAAARPGRRGDCRRATGHPGCRVEPVAGALPRAAPA